MLILFAENAKSEAVPGTGAGHCGGGFNGCAEVGEAEEKSGCVGGSCATCPPGQVASKPTSEPSPAGGTPDTVRPDSARARDVRTFVDVNEMTESCSCPLPETSFPS